MVLKLTCEMSGFRAVKATGRGRRSPSALGGSCRGMDVSDSHLPVFVSTMMALAQHLKEASTAPIAMVSVGSRVR